MIGDGFGHPLLFFVYCSMEQQFVPRRVKWIPDYAHHGDQEWHYKRIDTFKEYNGKPKTSMIQAGFSGVYPALWVIFKDHIDYQGKPMEMGLN